MKVQKRKINTPSTLHYAHRAEAFLAHADGVTTYSELAEAIEFDGPLNGRQFGHILFCVYLSSPLLASRVMTKDGFHGQGYDWCVENFTHVVDAYEVVPEQAAVMEPLYPSIEVQLSGQDGNAFAILGRMERALRHEGLSKERIAEFHSEATASDYDHLLRTCARWVTVA